jgi:cell division protein FtsQ
VSTTMTPSGPTTGSTPRIVPADRPEVVDADRPEVVDADRPEVLPDPPRFREPPVVLLPGAADIDAEAEPELRIEPKLRARRVEIRRAARRHRRRMVVCVGLLVVLVGAAAAALYSPLLDVDHIRVAGAYHLDDAEVVGTSGIGTGDRLFDLDPDAAVRRIERLPWVRQARVERHWPDGVTIRVTERAPVATVATSSGSKLAITTGGVVAGRATALDLALPTVTLETGVPRVGSTLPAEVARSVEVVGALPDSVTAMMSGASVAADGDMTVALDPSGEIRFGRAERVAAKFLAAETILGGAVQLQHLCRLDVRIPTAPTLSRSC